MLDVALGFLVKSLNSYLVARTGGSFGDAQATKLVDDAGKWAVKEDHVGVSVISLEEERALKSHLPETVFVNGRQVLLEPELKINLHVVFAANFKQYDHALRYVGHVLTYFQANPTFTPDEHAGLDPRIERLTLELQSLSYEQLNQIWAFIGGKQLPSVIYRVRMVTLRDSAPDQVGAPITRIDTTLHGRE